MPYGQDLAGSARRHLVAASLLHGDDRPGCSPGCKAVAGYLFGLAGELALKQMMKDSGMQRLHTSLKRDDPFYAHFPDLKVLLRNNARGRRQGELIRYASDPKLFQHWDTGMRYAPTGHIDERWTGAWKSQAEKLVHDMNR